MKFKLGSCRYVMCNIFFFFLFVCLPAEAQPSGSVRLQQSGAGTSGVGWAKAGGLETSRRSSNVPELCPHPPQYRGIMTISYPETKCRIPDFRVPEKNEAPPSRRTRTDALGHCPLSQTRGERCRSRSPVDVSGLAAGLGRLPT